MPGPLGNERQSDGAGKNLVKSLCLTDCTIRVFISEQHYPL